MKKVECSKCMENTKKRKVLKKRKLVKCEENDTFIDLYCRNIVNILYHSGKWVEEECGNHKLLLKKKDD